MSEGKKIPASVYRIEYPLGKRPKFLHADTSYIVVELDNGAKFLFNKRIFQEAKDKAENFFKKLNMESPTE